MLSSSRKTTYLKSPEEQEIIRLESKINQLNADLTAEKTKAAVALSEEKSRYSQFISRGRLLERERMIKICKLPEFNGREDVALKIALSGSPAASPESISSLLLNIPKKDNGRGQLAAYMVKLGNPEIGADMDAEYEEENTNILQSIASGEL